MMKQFVSQLFMSLLMNEMKHVNLHSLRQNNNCEIETSVRNPLISFFYAFFPCLSIVMNDTHLNASITCDSNVYLTLNT